LVSLGRLRGSRVVVAGVSEKVASAGVVLGDVCASSLDKATTVLTTLGHDRTVKNDDMLN